LYGFLGNDGTNNIDLLGNISFFENTNAGAGGIDTGQISALRKVIYDLNLKKGKNGEQCYKAGMNSKALTINQMYDYVKETDLVYLMAHGGRDVANKLTTIQGVGGSTFSSGLRNVAKSKNHQVYFYACNQDRSGRRTTDSDGHDIDWNEEITVPQSGLIYTMIGELNKLYKSDDCPCKSLIVISGPAD
jgi:hypothetical protein